MTGPSVTRVDVIVVGSGPGGATTARELALAGKRVLLLERGADYRQRFYYGTYLGALIYSDRLSLLFTEEGLNIIRPLMVGGATNMFCACAAPPPNWLKTRYGIDIDQEVSETIEELQIEPLPTHLRGEASTRLAEAAQSLGYNWWPQPKFLKPARSSDFDCGAKCMLGCRCGAKWTAGVTVDEAVAAGAELWTGARVDRVLTDHGYIQGVQGERAGKPFYGFADTVVLAAGGIGTPRILQRSGFGEAGRGMTMDVTVMVYGLARDRGANSSRPLGGNGNDPPMTWSWENEDVGYMLSTLVDPWLVYPLINSLKSPLHALSWPQWNNLLGVMIKLKDDISGGVFADGSIRKPLTAEDRERLHLAEDVCRAILVEAGADPTSIYTTPQRGTHPSGTVRIGTMVDGNLQSEVEGLFVCDASVFPEALGRPTVLTIIGLAKRLARHLVNGGTAA